MSRRKTEMYFAQSSVARGLGEWLVLTAGWLFLLFWNLITLLHFPRSPLLPQGLDLLQGLSWAVFTKFSGAGRSSAADWGTWRLLVDLNDVFMGREAERQTGDLGGGCAEETHQRVKGNGGFKGRSDQNGEKLYFNRLRFMWRWQLFIWKTNREMISLWIHYWITLNKQLIHVIYWNVVLVICRKIWMKKD